MKAKDLAKKMLKNPEFEVDMNFFDLVEFGAGFVRELRTFKIIGIGDIGFSDKVIKLDGDEL